jgi:DTW domain-containing protein YfiP
MTSDLCPRCHKPPALCVCADIKPLDNRIAVLILQHPQEQDVDLGTAHLTALHLKQATVKIGLSWPSLAKALDRPADPKKWATLYLGSIKPTILAPGQPVIAVTRKGAADPDQERKLAGLEGVILLDGTWSQAKAIWWRNAWLLKTQRIVVAPPRASRYGQLRREARREAVSTLEATALLLSTLEKRPEIADALHASFERLLERYKANKKSPT